MQEFIDFIEKGVKMSFPVIDERYLEKDWLHKAKENVATKTQTIVSSTIDKTHGVLTGFTDYTIVFLYFLLTGLAILFRSPIPKDWLMLSKKIGGRKISQRVEDLKEKVEKIKPKRVFKVVDIDTKRPMKVLKVNK